MCGSKEKTSDLSETQQSQAPVGEIEIGKDTPSLTISKPAISPKFEEWTHWTALTSKFVITTVSIAYALGLLITNFYFGRFGITDMSLLKANYILAGSWSLIPVFIVIVIVAIFYEIVISKMTNEKVIDYPRMILASFLMVLVMSSSILFTRGFIDVSIRKMETVA